MPRDGIADYHRAHYEPANIVLAAAGNLAHDELLVAIDRTFRSPQMRADADRGARAVAGGAAVDWR